MSSGIHPKLADLALPLEKMIALPGNPRIGNVDAIAASYDQFGQVKPIVVQPNGDGTYTVIAGNHQVEAARQLGWREIAAVQMDVDDEQAVAFALVDNRVTELGRTDPELLHDLLGEVVSVYPELFDAVGWDDFEYAALETSVQQMTDVASGAAGAYVPPALVSRPGEPLAPPGGQQPDIAIGINGDGEEENQFVAPAGVDHRATIVAGAPGMAQGQSGPRKASFQYAIVFDDGDQLKAWWDFVRFLRASPVYEGETIAARLLAFIDAHAEI